MAQLERTPLTELQRLCQDGEPLPASRHLGYRELIHEGEWNLPSDVIIGRRSTTPLVLASGALRSVMFDLTAESAEAIGLITPYPVFGSITDQIFAERPCDVGEEHITTQWVLFNIDFGVDGEPLYARIGGTVFDDKMFEDARDAWKEWGVDIVYGRVMNSTRRCQMIFRNGSPRRSRRLYCNV